MVEGCEIWILSHFENRRDFYLLLIGPKNIFKIALPQRMDLDGNFNFQLPIQSLLAILASN